MPSFKKIDARITKGCLVRYTDAEVAYRVVHVDGSVVHLSNGDCFIYRFFKESPFSGWWSCCPVMPAEEGYDYNLAWEYAEPPTLAEEDTRMMPNVALLGI